MQKLSICDELEISIKGLDQDPALKLLSLLREKSFDAAKQYIKQLALTSQQEQNKLGAVATIHQFYISLDQSEEDDFDKEIILTFIQGDFDRIKKMCERLPKGATNEVDIDQEITTTPKRKSKRIIYESDDDEEYTPTKEKYEPKPITKRQITKYDQHIFDTAMAFNNTFASAFSNTKKYQETYSREGKKFLKNILAITPEISPTLSDQIAYGEMIIKTLARYIGQQGKIPDIILNNNILFIDEEHSWKDQNKYCKKDKKLIGYTTYPGQFPMGTVILRGATAGTLTEKMLRNKSLFKTDDTNHETKRRKIDSNEINEEEEREHLINSIQEMRSFILSHLDIEATLENNFSPL